MSLSAVTYLHFEIVLVDQASSDGSVKATRNEFPHVRVIENWENTGFAGGCNTAIKDAFSRGADFVFLLNNDTIVAPDLLDKLVETAQSDSRIGIVGPLMLYYDAPGVVWSAGGTIGGRGESRMLGQGDHAANRAGMGASDVDFVVGCGMLAKRALWEQISPLDEQYFLYYEEADWCTQARKAGWRVVTAPNAHLWHKISRSTGNDSALTLYYMRRNVLRYLSRHAARPTFSCAAAIVDTLRLALVWTIQGKTPKARLLLYAITDFLRGRLGRADHLDFSSFETK